jgi:gliding motility-associated-like protein
MNYSSSTTDAQQACDSYTWIDGIIYTTSNNSATYIIPNGNSNGCDSIITLDLTINYSDTTADIQQVCDSYTWIDGITYTASNNSATFLYQTINGCDSLVTLDLTMNYSDTTTDVKQACGSYTWVDGINYTASNNSATFLYQTINGCDSLVTLDLTINDSTTSTDVQQACDSYTWIDGINYTVSNNAATFLYQTINGCDSLVTLDLTINYSSSRTDVQQACDSYTWIDGIIYTTSNNAATYIIPNGNINGCDSIITLDLTINYSDTTADVQQACGSYTWVDGINYTASNNSATFLYQTINGCDSLVTLDLTINDLPTALISGTTIICEDEFTPITFTLQNGLSPYNVNYNINGVATSNSFSNSGLNTIMVSPSTTTVYSLVDITDANNCFNTANDSVTINVNEKVNAIISGGGDICNDGSQATIDIITDDSTIVNVTYTNGSDTMTLSGVGPFEIITNQAGVYMITDVVDIYGCVGTYSGNATITVNPLPLAEFSFFPQPTDLDNPHITFTNFSFGHTSAIWDFGDGSTLNDTISRFLHTYNDTGHYKINLAVSNEFGCTDTIAYTIIIDPIFIIYIPNAFTPNGDNINDAFGPSVYGISEFEMTIYNRWGQIIYHTTEQNKPWDGTINNNETQAGVYTYSIVATDLKDKPHKFVGAFTLFR